jgi:hypothetical protein
MLSKPRETSQITDRLSVGVFRKAVYPRPGIVADLHRILHQLGASSPNLVKIKIYFIYVNFYIKSSDIDGVHRLWLVSKISFCIKMS